MNEWLLLQPYTGIHACNTNRSLVLWARHWCTDEIVELMTATRRLPPLPLYLEEDIIHILTDLACPIPYCVQTMKQFQTCAMSEQSQSTDGFSLTVT